MTQRVTIKVILMLVVSLTLVNADHSGNSIDYCVHIRSCCDLRTFPPKKVSSGVYKMSMGTFTSTDVYCDMGTDGGGWIVIQRNRKNSQLQSSFDRNWKEYEDGFGDLNEDFWAGLKLMNTLTQNGQWEMRVDFQKNDKSWSYLHYNQFSVGSTSDEYRLTVGGYTGGSGDYFTTGDEPSNNAKFTTYDNDNDVHSGNCAIKNGGWWYYSCFDIQPNFQPPYYNWPNPALFIEMKIRPKGCTMQ